jgi:NAD(P) transhydrogenase subunit alpha
MIVGFATEVGPQERRVALVPRVAPLLAKVGLEVMLQTGAGLAAGYPDADYVAHGVKLAEDRGALFASAQILACVGFDASDLASLSADKHVIGLLNPLGNPQQIKSLAERGVTAFALELLPRITRAQPMDALTAMATVAGYKAVLLAAERLDKMFPLLMTAAGTITPAHVFVLGAGVAGLQAIATAHRLGAVVLAYDIRPVVKEQVESLGAKFLQVELSMAEGEGEGGYARAMDEAFYARQREAMKEAVADSDVVITTAAVPGKKAPILITTEMVQGMRSGSVLIDLAAETGGNCEATRPGETYTREGVTIMGPINLAASVPRDASSMYARNIAAFMQHLVRDGQVQINLDDEIIREALVTRDGKVVHPRVKVDQGFDDEMELLQG